MTYPHTLDTHLAPRRPSDSGAVAAGTAGPVAEATEDETRHIELNVADGPLPSSNLEPGLSNESEFMADPDAKSAAKPKPGSLTAPTQRRSFVYDVKDQSLDPNVMAKKILLSGVSAHVRAPQRAAR